MRRGLLLVPWERASRDWSGRRLRVLVALAGLAGLVISAVLMWSVASAAFISTTPNPMSTLSTGTWVVPHVLKWFGDGQYGQGGVISGDTTSPGQEVTAATNWTSVSTGAGHSCGTRTDGTLWCWGANSSGQVGNGDAVTPQPTPVQVAGATWATVAVGDYHTCATLTDRTLWCWGGQQ